MRLDFWFDPGCAWTWITSRWVIEVAPRRDLDVAWRSFSLFVKNGDDPDVSDRHREKSLAAHRALRVVEAVRAQDEAGVGTLYTELGRRIHHDGGPPPADLGPVLAAAGLPTDLAAAADDEALDALIGTSMAEADELVGDDIGVPVIALPVGSGRCAISGPILSPAPTGDDALRLFDLVAAAVIQPGFFELKRTRNTGPQFPARP